MCKCVRARARAPPGEGPGGAAAGGGRAAPLLSVSGLRGPRRVLPAAGVPRASRLPACHLSRRARPCAGAGGARGSLLPPAGARVPAVGSRTLPPGHRVGALGAGAQRLGLPGGSAAWRPAGSPPAGTTEAATCAVPSRRRLDMERGSEERGVCRALSRWWVSPPPPTPRSRPRRVPRATAAPAPSRRQDSLAPVVMVTAAPVNERLSDTRAPAQPDVARGARRSRPTLALLGLAGEQIGVKYQTEIGAPRVGFIPLTNSGAWS